jgi:hypothetical protein
MAQIECVDALELVMRAEKEEELRVRGMQCNDVCVEEPQQRQEQELLQKQQGEDHQMEDLFDHTAADTGRGVGDGIAFVTGVDGGVSPGGAAGGGEVDIETLLSLLPPPIPHPDLGAAAGTARTLKRISVSPHVNNAAQEVGMPLLSAASHATLKPASSPLEASATLAGVVATPVEGAALVDQFAGSGELAGGPDSTLVPEVADSATVLQAPVGAPASGDAEMRDADAEGETGGSDPGLGNRVALEPAAGGVAGAADSGDHVMQRRERHTPIQLPKDWATSSPKRSGVDLDTTAKLYKKIRNRGSPVAQQQQAGGSGGRFGGSGGRNGGSGGRGGGSGGRTGGYSGRTGGSGGKVRRPLIASIQRGGLLPQQQDDGTIDQQYSSLVDMVFDDLAREPRDGSPAGSYSPCKSPTPCNHLAQSPAKNTQANRGGSLGIRSTRGSHTGGDDDPVSRSLLGLTLSGAALKQEGSPGSSLGTRGISGGGMGGSSTGDQGKGGEGGLNRGGPPGPGCNPTPALMELTQDQQQAFVVEVAGLLRMAIQERSQDQQQRYHPIQAFIDRCRVDHANVVRLLSEGHFDRALAFFLSHPQVFSLQQATTPQSHWDPVHWRAGNQSPGRVLIPRERKLLVGLKAGFVQPGAAAHLLWGTERGRGLALELREKLLQALRVRGLLGGLGGGHQQQPGRMSLADVLVLVPDSMKHYVQVRKLCRSCSSW